MQMLPLRSSAVPVLLHSLPLRKDQLVDPRIVLLIAVYVLTMTVRLMVKRSPAEHGAVVALAAGAAIVAGLLVVDSTQQLIRGVTVGARVAAAAEEPHSPSPLYGLTSDQVRGKIGAPSMTNGETWYYDSPQGTRWVRFREGRLVDEGGPAR